MVCGLRQALQEGAESSFGGKPAAATVEEKGKETKPKPKPKPWERKGRGGDGVKGPSYTKKLGAKISSISSKVTEIKCLQTNLTESNLCLAIQILIQNS